MKNKKFFITALIISSFISIKPCYGITINPDNNINNFNIFNKEKMKFINTQIESNKNKFKNIFNKEIQEKNRINNLYKNSQKIKNNLLNYFSTVEHRESTLKRAIELHGGEKTNNCVFFVSEALRRSGYYVPEHIANTYDLTNYLLDNGWHICYDYKKLTKGDICFNKVDPTIGISSHVYTFTSWCYTNSVAYIIDNQSPYIHERSLFYNEKELSNFWYFVTKNPYIK